MATEQTEDNDQQQHGGFDDETMRMLSANLPDRIFRAPDPRIQMAAMEAERTHQMTPVLKEELRLRILAKRMERGEPDIETSHTPKTYELTEEEKLKRERRKEQNRRAAKKCREKRKLKNLDVAEKFDIFREENDKLSKEIHCIQKQRKQLMDFLKEHVVSGKCRLPTSQTETASDCSAKSCRDPCREHRALSKLSSSSTSPSPGLPGISATFAPPTCMLPKLSIAIPPNYSQSQINNSSGSQILASSINQGNENVQSQLRSNKPASSLHNLPMATPTCTVSISSVTDHPSSMRNQPNYLNQQQQHHVCDLSYNPAIAATISHLTTPSPKPSQLSRPVMSRTPSTTAPFPPQQSPGTNHQSSSITLTPPPSVSSEQYFVPESPSVVTSFTTTTTTTSSLPNDLMVDHSVLTPPILYPQYHPGTSLSYQLSPAESLAGKSPPDFDILNDKMFDDDDDDDDEDDKSNACRNDFSHILNTLG